jgi:(1->4)-alpha-D-glucan 1-alpha-D-glucosylmutase
MGEPIATYRLQLHPGFGFDDAVAVVPYLAQLGISHLYLSPILQAADGSTHGYDVVDCERVNAGLGGDDGLRRLADATAAHGLAILLDVVPNHMSIAGMANRWWLDVLENGISSYYAHYFDVDWPTGPGTDDRISLPVLADRYGAALVSGQLGVAHDGAGRFAIRAGELRLPISPRALGSIVRRAGERIRHAELSYVGDALLDLERSADPAHRRRRHRDKAVLQRRLAELASDPRCAGALDAEVRALDADPVELDAVLEALPYRLVHWSTAANQLSYRRFFDISSLVGLRTEDRDVFEASHVRILEWLADGTIAGVRVDHVDGLRDPAGYLACLRARAPNAWIVVEKIVAADEALPAWPVEGTTGYETADRIACVLADPAGEAALTRTFEAYTGVAFDPAAARRAARRDVMSDALHSEVTRLVELASRACAISPACRDYTRAEIETALVELLAGYPVYRTYLGGGAGADAERAIDRERIAAAAAAARELPGVAPDLLGFLAAALGFELASAEAHELAHAAQQVTGGIVAKGDEDTLSYRMVRLVARCEVGADLGVLAESPAVVHARLAAGAPRALLATSTHDTKRAGDVRARNLVLTEQPAAWAAAVDRWRARAERGWGDVAPDRTLEYFMWQSLVAAWPVTAPRAHQLAEKAAREARLRTTWRRPDTAYEAAMHAWLDGVLGDPEVTAELARFAEQLAPRGTANALAQLLIKLTAPGVPDFYQGDELDDDSLVDPDNRRPVDFAAREVEMHGLIESGTAPDPSDLGAAKLYTVLRVLALRRRMPALFAGDYRALYATGPRADRVFAFARGDAMISVVPRLGPVDPETMLALPPGRWRDMLADRSWSGSITVEALWSRFPIALLVRA